MRGYARHRVIASDSPTKQNDYNVCSALFASCQVNCHYHWFLSFDMIKNLFDRISATLPSGLRGSRLAHKMAGQRCVAKTATESAFSTRFCATMPIYLAENDAALQAASYE